MKVKSFLGMVSLGLFFATGDAVSKNSYEDKTIESYRLNLLEIGFSGVSKMPLNPHFKNRSRAQQKVVEACLELGQAKTAEKYIAQLENWQHWMGFANLAYYYTTIGQLDLAKAAMQHSEAMLNMADEISSGKILATTPSPLIDSLEGWRYKQVKAKIYEIHYRLGNPAILASELEQDFDEALLASVQVKQLYGERGTYVSAMEQLRAIAGNTNFEVVHHALLGMVQLADLQYGELDLPRWMDEEIIPRFKKTPVFMRMDILGRLAEIALKHKDPAQTKIICDLMDGYVENAALPAGFHIVEKVKAIALRFEAGDTVRAEEQLEELVVLYAARHDFIVDIDRAEILCHLAETYHLMTHTGKALEHYKKAIIEGQINPNSRPRADDLNAICCSMAVSGVEPSEEIFRSLKEMKQQLGCPW